MDVKQLQHNFINEEIWILTFGGGFQRANIYCNNPDKDVRQKLRSFIKSIVETLFTKSYKDNEVESDAHIKNIIALKAEIDSRFSTILTNRRITFGVVQKLLNLYLKYQWCMGGSSIPPHCPVDRIILTKAKVTPLPNWTMIDSPEEYQLCINALVRASSKDGKKLAEWELSEFGRRSNY